MPTCLVFGASGQIGRHLVPALLAEGHEVVAISRMPRESPQARVRWLQADVHAAPPALPRIDAVFSLGPLVGLAAWLEAARLEGMPRVIAFGSQSVISKIDSSDACERALAQRLDDGEQALATLARSRGFAHTLFRPTLIYGSGLDRSLTPIARFVRRWRVFPRVAAATGLRQPVHAADLARACLAAWPCAASQGATYALGGGERVAFATMLERVRASVGASSMAVPIPLAGLAVASRLLRGLRWPAPSAAAIARLRVDLVADDRAARADFGWAPRGFAPTASTWCVPVSAQY